MALFSNKPKATKKASKPIATAPREMVAAPLDGRLENVIRAPWMSEKALIMTEKGVYVFAVPEDATKQEIARAIEQIYKVTPRKVNIVNTPGKRKALRTKRGFGTRAARHKAYVYLKKGDTITFA